MGEDVNILVTEQEVRPDGRTYLVYVGEGNDREEFVVGVSDDYWAKNTSRIVSREDFIKKSFRFIMARESRDIILKEFDLSSIPKYFPEYEEVMRMELGH